LLAPDLKDRYTDVIPDKEAFPGFSCENQQDSLSWSPILKLTFPQPVYTRTILSPIVHNEKPYCRNDSLHHAVFLSGSFSTYLSSPAHQAQAQETGSQEEY
jgi:hypothetical protein